MTDMRDENAGNTRSELAIGLRADWGTGPLWVSVGDEFSDPHDAEDISEVATVGDELRQAIAAWNDQFQSTYNDIVPQDSGIRDPRERAAFVAAGRELARRICAELSPEIAVRYAGLDGKGWENVR